MPRLAFLVCALVAWLAPWAIPNALAAESHSPRGLDVTGRVRAILRHGRLAARASCEAERHVAIESVVESYLDVRSESEVA